MRAEHINRESLDRQKMADEEKIREKTDEDGSRWKKVYFGGGAHFQNWLSQFTEIRGPENVKVEAIDSDGFTCYEESGEKVYRIWVKDNTEH